MHWTIHQLPDMCSQAIYMRTLNEWMPPWLLFSRTRPESTHTTIIQITTGLFYQKHSIVELIAVVPTGTINDDSLPI